VRDVIEHRAGRRARRDSGRDVLPRLAGITDSSGQTGRSGNFRLGPRADWHFKLAACAPQRTASRDLKDCFRETRKPTRGTRALPGRRHFGGKLERYQAKIGVPPNSWRIRFTPLCETSYFDIFSAAARWKAYIIDEPIISTRSSPLRPILYGRSS